jgi:hypothetical protein
VAITSTQIRFAPVVTSMRDSLEPYLPWLEKVLGCALPDTITFEIELPIGRLVIADLLKGVPVDDFVKKSPHLGQPLTTGSWLGA